MNGLPSSILDSRSSSALPLPQADVSVRVATMADVPFVDRLQKMHSKMVGFMPGKQIEGKINAGEVLIAESDEATRHEATKGKAKTPFPPLRRFVAPSLRRLFPWATSSGRTATSSATTWGSSIS
jgi:hypothetical protein